MTDRACLGEELTGEWWKDKATLEHECAVHSGNCDLARAHGRSEKLYRSWRDRLGIPSAQPGTGRNGADVPPPVESPVSGQAAGLRVDFRRGTATLVTDPQDVRQNPELGDVDQLVRDRGLDPDEWLVDRVRVNEWEGFYKAPDGANGFRAEKVTLRQLVASLRRKPPLELIFPAVEVAERVKPQPGASRPAARLVALLGDQQADYHDEELHQAFLLWAADAQPGEVVLLGDTADFPTISRHTDRPNWNSSPQQCVDTAYRLLSEYRDVLPAAVIRKLRGNHDWRLESELLTRAERMFGLAPAADGNEQVPGYSIRRLLHLDALGIELVGNEGDKWEMAEVQVAPSVWARHQPPNEKKLLRLNRDVIAGHTHRQSIRQVTVFNDADEPVVRTLVEAGGMCRTDGLGYAEHPDWQAGFVTAAIADDGSASYDLAVWRHGRLTWRGETWKA